MATDSFVITERDHELLLSLYRYRYLSASQVQRLHFPSAQTAARRLRLLAEGGYVSLFRSPAIPDRLATLARAGAETVAERLGVPLDETGWDSRRQRPKDYLFLKHFLAASDFRISLTRACAAHPAVRLLGFLPEHVVERTPAGAVQKYIRDVIADTDGGRQKLAHTPDGVFALGGVGRAALFFLEIDRGTEVLTTADRGVLKIVRFYLQYLIANAYQRYQEDFGVAAPFRAFRVLLVTPRAQSIRSLCGPHPFEPAPAKRFIWLAGEDALLGEGLLSRRWTPLDPADTRTYSIDPS
jgi:hypothetical protein